MESAVLRQTSVQVYSEDSRSEPAQLLEKLSLRLTGYIASFIVLSLLMSGSAFVYLWLKSSWLWFTLLGLLIPFSLEIVRRSLLAAVAGQLNSGIDHLIASHGNHLALKYALENSKSALDRFGVLIVGLLLTHFIPFLSLTICSLSAVPAGLRILEQGTQGDFYNFLFWGGLVPATWVVCCAWGAIQIVRDYSRSDTMRKQQSRLFPTESV